MEATTRHTQMLFMEFGQPVINPDRARKSPRKPYFPRDGSGQYDMFGTDTNQAVLDFSGVMTTLELKRRPRRKKEDIINIPPPQQGLLSLDTVVEEAPVPQETGQAGPDPIDPPAIDAKGFYAPEQAYDLFPHLFLTPEDPAIYLASSTLKQRNSRITGESLNALEDALESGDYVARNKAELSSAAKIREDSFDDRFAQLSERLQELGVVKNIGLDGDQARYVFDESRRDDLVRYLASGIPESNVKFKAAIEVGIEKYVAAFQSINLVRKEVDRLRYVVSVKFATEGMNDTMMANLKRVFEKGLEMLGHKDWIQRDVYSLNDRSYGQFSITINRPYRQDMEALRCLHGFAIKMK